MFVLLTGLSAWLYGQRQADPRRATAAFLLKRGLFLVVLELTLVNFAWTFQLPPDTLYLQVIWAIGLSMIALAGLLWLPRPALLVLAIAVVAGHNLFDGLRVQGNGLLAVLWKVLHQRDWIEAGALRLRTSYPLLPWIGVIALGYLMGPWFGRERAQSSASAGCCGQASARWPCSHCCGSPTSTGMHRGSTRPPRCAPG